MKKTKKITFIGAGNMARSIIKGLVNAGYPASEIMACNRTAEKLAFFSQLGINTSTDNDQGVAFADVVVLAVKPQFMQAMCESLAQHGKCTDKVFVSIAAGLTVARLQAFLGCPCPVIRVMPNTPSLIGRGVSGLYANDDVSDSDKTFVAEMMNAVGTTIWVPEESQINGVIAAAGSSPAYFFLFLEAMEQEALNMGFDKNAARAMVENAMLGAAEMVCHNSDLELSELRAQVTSKGGTTAKAIEHFQQQGLSELVQNAMRAAVTRAQEMEKTF
ncbi:pyrroline-5-carboxylate reductase [Alteromonas sediminis]|uniref:Pyrroline-5-carboxylate reductase n=1 Tax=Alteromonas sediminis TaxID=2259342 RepID=A0A3N5YE57_9ALTE|nr:pyrroline-5-carboxylate reductase [Alteromonas sediminis]RPJ67915.1 pyrroline-5-carboxylate reductase [Alteromonas sediminis]